MFTTQHTSANFVPGKIEKYDHQKVVSRLCMNYLAGVQRWRKVYCAKYFILHHASMLNTK